MSKGRHVLVCGRVHDDGMELLRQAAGTTHEVIEEDPLVLADRLPDADALVIRICKTEQKMFEGLERLKVVSRHGVGCDNIPVDYLTGRGVLVMVTGDANSESVAEHAIFMLLSLMRQAVAMDKAVREGDWDARRRLRTVQASGRHVLVLGAGRIGRLVVAKAGMLGMVAHVHDPFLAAADCEGMGARHVATLDEALGEVDAVTLHMPSLGRTVIGERELGLMRKGSFLVNVSRGDLVDEGAVANSLRTGHLAGAAFDVFEPEPPIRDNPLLSHDNVLLSPHSAALTEESKRQMGISCVQNALDALDGRVDPNNVFNRSVLND